MGLQKVWGYRRCGATEGVGLQKVWGYRRRGVTEGVGLQNGATECVRLQNV